MEHIEGATPLFVAANNGHLNVVRYLVEMGADISTKTTSAQWEYDNMSPLYGALIEIDKIRFNCHSCRFVKKIPGYQERTAIVQFLLESGAESSHLPTSKIPPWMTHLCNSSVTAIVALSNSGMSLEQLDPMYESTILHHWVSNPLGELHEIRTEPRSSLAVVKLLVEKGANVTALDAYGLSPILRAAHKFDPDTSRECFSILEYLLQRDEINREDKIKALELVGAVILSNSENAHLFGKAFACWRRALQLREMETMGSGPLLKTVMQRKPGLPTEWITREQLEHLILHPSEYPMQGFLVQLRIYSSLCWDAVHWCFLRPFFYHPVKWLQELREFSQLINYLWAILEMISHFQPQNVPVSESFPAKVVGKLVKTLSKLRPTDQILNPETITTTLSIILSTEPFHNYFHYEDYFQRLLGLITVLAAHPEMLNAENKRILTLLVKRSEKPIGSLSGYSPRTLLIVGCIKGFPNLSTLRLLMECGAEPNAADMDGSGPLHQLLKNNNEGFNSNDVGCCCCLRFLIECGADLDRVNNAGKTPKDLCPERNIDHLLGKPRELKCLSSIVINTQGIPYSEEILPFALHKCVELH